MDPPIGLLQEEVLDVADLAVGGMDVVPGDRFGAPQMLIASGWLNMGKILDTPAESQ